MEFVLAKLVIIPFELDQITILLLFQNSVFCKQNVEWKTMVSRIDAAVVHATSMTRGKAPKQGCGDKRKKQKTVIAFKRWKYQHFEFTGPNERIFCFYLRDM